MARLTVAHVISITKNESYAVATVDGVLEPRLVLDHGVTREAEHGSLVGGGLVSEVDAGAEVLLYPVLVEEAEMVIRHVVPLADLGNIEG